MYLGIIGWYNEESFMKAAARGLKAIELDINENSCVPDFIANIPNIKKYIEKTGVGVSAVGQWGTTRILPDGKPNPEQLAFEKQLMKGASEIGCGIYMTGCNRTERSLQEDTESAIEYLGLLVEYGREIGVKVCLYNCHWNSFLDHSEPEALEKVLNALPELGLKYDPSHPATQGRDWKAEVRKWGKRICHVHIKGVLALEEGWDHPPAGLDEIDWRAFMGLLYAAGYEGCLSLEPHSPVWQSELGEKGIDFSIKYISSMIV